MKRGKKFGLYIVAGVLLTLLGLFYELMMDLNEIITIIFISVGAVLIIGSVLRYTRYGEVNTDERTRKLGSAAISFSWFLTFVLVNILFWIDYFEILKLSVGQVIGIIVFFMIFSGAILKSLYRKKGDIH